MDIGKISEFHTYSPLYDEDPSHQLDKYLIDLPYITKQDHKKIKHAYEYSRDAHVGVKRHSGEPYIVHPVRVVGFLKVIQPDVPSIQAALLHDVIEDTPITYEDVLSEFGEEVASLCDGLVKVAKVRLKGQNRQVETLKKTFLAMGKDLRVIFIKLADRLHNIQTLHYHPKKEKRVRIAQETLSIFVPIAKRLGLYAYQGLLENGAFNVIHPKEYKRIFEYINKRYTNAKEYKKVGVDNLIYLCEQEKIEYESITGRLKSPYRIWKKLQKYHTKDVSKVMDVMAFRVITGSVSDCYNMLGIIHKHYTPIFAKMKDYIALPKPNGYKSLHTTILGMFEFPVEIQVRTNEMNRIAEYGVAAHFAYKETGGSVQISEKQASWIQKLQDIVKKYKDQDTVLTQNFRNHLDVEILDKKLFVYTPKGDIIELPEGSTVLDFAFRVHTDIGLKFKNAFINGRIVPIDYRLKMGDIVDIKTFKNKFTAKKTRHSYLYMPSSKTKLNRFVRAQEKDQILGGVIFQINKKLESFGLPSLENKENLITKKYSGDQREKLLWTIYDRQLSPTKLIRNLYPEIGENTKKEQQEIVALQDTYQSKQTSDVVVDYTSFSGLTLCPECNPISGDKIICKSDKHGMKIHKLECVALKTVKYNKLYEAHRKHTQPSKYILKLQLRMIDKPGSLLKLLKIFDFYQFNVQNLNTKESDDGWAIIYLDVHLTHPYKAEYIINELKSKKQLLKIVTKHIQ